MKKFLLIMISVIICNNLLASDFTNYEGLELESSDTAKINIYDLQKLKLYPNPANDFLYIDYNIVFIKEAKVKIYNSIGAVVYSKVLEEKSDKLKVPVSELKDGLYFCSLQIDGTLLNTRKVLISHR